MGRNEFITRLQDLYEKAETLFNDGNGTEAAEILKQEVVAIEAAAEIPGAIIPWLDATSLLANILLSLSRPTEALEYGKAVYEVATRYLPNTLEEIYAEELLANCSWETGDKATALKLWNAAKERLDYELEEAVDLRNGIERKLDE